MNKLIVKSLPLKDVVIDIAEELNTNYEEDCNLYTVQIPKKVGTGYVEGIDFGNGFGMLNYHCAFHEKTTIQFTYDQVHPIKFLHCYDGGFTHKFAESEQINKAVQYENIIVGSPHFNGHVLVFEKEVIVGICSIEIDRKNFIKKIACLLDKEQDMGEINEMLRDAKAEKKFYYKGKYSLALSNIIREVQETKKTPLLYNLFYESRSYAMLVHQLEQYYNDKQQDSVDYLIRAADLGFVTKIIEFIEQNIDKPMTLATLEKEFGINHKKLQYFFKTLYGQTVNSFIQDKRLEIAMELMKNSTKNISEIADAIGINSKSYFSKIFKEKYNLSPSIYLKEIRKNNRLL